MTRKRLSTISEHAASYASLQHELKRRAIGGLLLAFTQVRQ